MVNVDLVNINGYQCHNCTTLATIRIQGIVFICDDCAKEIIIRLKDLLNLYE